MDELNEAYEHANSLEVDLGAALDRIEFLEEERAKLQRDVVWAEFMLNTKLRVLDAWKRGGPRPLGYRNCKSCGHLVPIEELDRRGGTCDACWNLTRLHEQNDFLRGRINELEEKLRRSKSVIEFWLKNDPTPIRRVKDGSDGERE